jgi:hypothetical protein
VPSSGGAEDQGMATTTLPRPPRVPRWAKITLGVLGVVLVVAGAAAAWFVSMLLGGIDDLVTGGRVQADDARVVAAREGAERDLGAELAELLRGTSGGTLARTSVSRCVPGQHNWKVNDDYDLYCGQGEAVVVRGEMAGFRSDALALHEHLQAQGWVAAPGYDERDPAVRGIAAVVAERWDPVAHDPPPLPELYGGSYSRDGTTLVVSWVAPADPLSPEHPFYAAEWDLPGGGAVGNDRLGTAVPAGSYGTVVRLSTEYFRE